MTFQERAKLAMEQLAKQPPLTYKQRVGGSNPSAPTIKSRVSEFRL